MVHSGFSGVQRPDPHPPLRAADTLHRRRRHKAKLRDLHRGCLGSSARRFFHGICASCRAHRGDDKRDGKNRKAMVFMSCARTLEVPDTSTYLCTSVNVIKGGGGPLRDDGWTRRRPGPTKRARPRIAWRPRRPSGAVGSGTVGLEAGGRRADLFGVRPEIALKTLVGRAAQPPRGA